VNVADILNLLAQWERECSRDLPDGESTQSVVDTDLHGATVLSPA
jgi:hypothetical protein